jgi:hypothetical protein
MALINYSVHENPPVDLITDYLNPTHILTHYSSTVHHNIIHKCFTQMLLLPLKWKDISQMKHMNSLEKCKPMNERYYQITATNTNKFPQAFNFFSLSNYDQHLPNLKDFLLQLVTSDLTLKINVEIYDCYEDNFTTPGIF